MNENTKTLAFAAVAAVALLFGYVVSRPGPTGFEPEAEVGKDFFPDFTKAQAAAQTKITTFDSATDEKRDMTVALIDGQWRINPDKQAYPEVNLERLADVVNSVIGLEKMSVVGDDPTKHVEYGVVDPAKDAELSEGKAGVGKRVDVLDENRRTLLSLIIGKLDKGSANVHFVRQPDRDRVYRTEINDGKLTTRFDEWVPADLLGASGGDLRYVSVQDYGIDLTQEQQQPQIQGGVIVLPQLQLERVNRSKAVFAKKPAANPVAQTDQWQLEDLQTYDKGKKAFVERKLGENEELAPAKLAELGRALGSVKIVDVVRKPKLLAEDFTAEKDFLTNEASPVRSDRESIMQLIQYGFQPTQARGSSEARLTCFEGEMVVGFGNGVEYALRFGDITGKGRGGETSEGKAEAEEKPAETPTDETEKGSSTAPNRYLLVTARFNESLIPKPQLAELPPESKPAEEPKPDAKKEEPAKEPTKVEPDDEKAKEETKPEEPQADEAKADSVKKDEAKAEAKPPAISPEERKRIETENKSKQEKYDAQVKEGREKAKELNGRFAEWFYVISDATYQGLNVDPTKLIADKPPETDKPDQPATPDLPQMPLLPTNP